MEDIISRRKLMSHLRPVRLAALASAPMLFLLLPALADEPTELSASPFKITGAATLATDYIFRGYTQTDGEPAIQGSIGVNHESGLSVSLWGSNVDFNDGDEASIEIDGTLSYTYSLDDKTVLSVGGVYYAYPGTDSDLDYDYVEGFAGVTRSFDAYGDYGLQIFYSPEFFAETGDAIYVTGTASIPTPVENLKFAGSVGYQWIDDNEKYGAPDYADWSAGLNYTYDKVMLGLKYTDTSVSDERCNNLCVARVMGSLSVNF